MLIRPEGDGVVAIGQAAHAWMSGQLARAWGNERFDTPEPREEVCLAAEQHDVGMAEWDLAPRLHPSEGRPLSFMEMALEDHLRLWSAAPAKLMSQSAYAALLVSMHGTALYELRDLARLEPAEAEAVRAYLARERALAGADACAAGRRPRAGRVATSGCCSPGTGCRWRSAWAGPTSWLRRCRAMCGSSRWPTGAAWWTRGRSRAAELTVRCEGRRLTRPLRRPRASSTPALARRRRWRSSSRWRRGGRIGA